jgi:hypothetical protein
LGQNWSQDISSMHVCHEPFFCRHHHCVVATVFRSPTLLPVFLAYFYVLFSYFLHLLATVFIWIHQPTCLCTLTSVFVSAQFLEWHNSWQIYGLSTKIGIWFLQLVAACSLSWFRLDNTTSLTSKLFRSFYNCSSSFLFLTLHPSLWLLYCYTTVDSSIHLNTIYLIFFIQHHVNHKDNNPSHSAVTIILDSLEL